MARVCGRACRERGEIGGRCAYHRTYPYALLLYPGREAGRQRLLKNLNTVYALKRLPRDRGYTSRTLETCRCLKGTLKHNKKSEQKKIRVFEQWALF